MYLIKKVIIAFVFFVYNTIMAHSSVKLCDYMRKYNIKRQFRIIPESTRKSDNIRSALQMGVPSYFIICMLCDNTDLLYNNENGNIFYTLLDYPYLTCELFKVMVDVFTLQYREKYNKLPKYETFYDMKYKKYSSVFNIIDYINNRLDYNSNVLSLFISLYYDN